MRICLNKKADSRFLKAECKRERVEGQSLCHGCVAEGKGNKEDEWDIYMPIREEAPRRHRPVPTPEPREYTTTATTASRPVSGRNFADLWYTHVTTSTAI